MTNTTLLEFPCDFPVKIIGVNSTDFIKDIKGIALKHFSEFKNTDLTYKMSGKSNYLAMTVNVRAESQSQLDGFYQDVTKHPDIKMVL